MSVSLADLLTSNTEAETAALIIEYLDSVGFAASSWQNGNLAKHLVNLFARILSQISSVIPQIAALGFIGLATGDAKTITAREVYGTERVAATKTQGAMVLTATAGAPPYTITAGQLVAADQPTGPANTYRNIGGGSLAPGGTLTPTWEAETAGTAGNIATGITLYLRTPLVGVSVSNPAVSGSTTWITTPGTDAETDERLEERSLGQFDVLTYGVNDGGYKQWALEADSTVTRVLVQGDNPGGAGTVGVICATATGPVSGSQVTAISNYIYGITDGIGRRPLNDVPTVSAATTLAQNFTATVQVLTGSATDATAIETAITAFLGSLDIGGLIVPPATQGKMLFAQLVETVMALDDVVNVVFAAPTADITFAVDSTEVIVPTYSITVVGV